MREMGRKRGTGGPAEPAATLASRLDLPRFHRESIGYFPAPLNLD
jgi:hypothetical protein